MAPDLIESTAYGGSERRSGIDPGGGVSEVGGRRWRASEHAGSAGRNPEVTYSECAEWLVGGRAARSAAYEEGGNGSISEIPDKSYIFRFDMLQYSRCYVREPGRDSLVRNSKYRLCVTDQRPQDRA